MRIQDSHAELLYTLERHLDDLYASEHMDVFRVIKNMFRLFIALDENRILLRLLANPNISQPAKRILIRRLVEEFVPNQGDWEEIYSSPDFNDRFIRKIQNAPNQSATLTIDGKTVKIHIEYDNELERIMGAISNQDFGSDQGFLSALEDIAVDGILYSANKDGRLDFVEQEMYEILEMMTKETELNKVLSDNSIPRRKRLKIVDVLFRDKVDKRTFALLKHATAYISIRRFWQNLYWMCDIISTKKNKIVAHVTSSHSFNQAQRERLGRVLEQKYGRNVEVAITVDPALIGGVKIQIGSDFVDGTVLGKLEEFSNELRIGV
ncbi:MAG: ATP synthase F1 subunit delta [Bifidobacteriaceae bacterium]|jgi:F-type H+-transporting ATPase subunit delta|nr:ATP synthase F1 subunit delta [Bifidobacteriaceae bacterium]